MQFINVNNVWLIRQIDNKWISSTEKNLLKVLGAYARDDGSNIRPSIKTLMQDTGYGRTCVKDTIKALITKKFLIRIITQKKGSPKPHEYSLNLDLVINCQNDKFIDKSQNTEIISKSPHDPDLGHEATQIRPCSDPDLGRQVFSNKYLKSNEEVKEKVDLASSMDKSFFSTQISTNQNTKPRNSKKSKKKNSENDVAFSDLSSCWLRPDRMKKAREEFDKHAISNEDRESILAAGMSFIEGEKTKQTDPRYIPFLFTWLKDKRFNEGSVINNKKHVSENIQLYDMDYGSRKILTEYGEKSIDKLSPQELLDVLNNMRKRR